VDCEVDDGPEWRRDGNPVVRGGFALDGDIAAGACGAPVDDYARAAPEDAEGHRHLDPSQPLAADLPQRRRAPVAEDGLGPAAQDGDHPASVPSELRPPHRVDAAPYSMQPPLCEPMLDRLRVKAQL